MSKCSCVVFLALLGCTSDLCADWIDLGKTYEVEILSRYTRGRWILGSHPDTTTPFRGYLQYTLPTCGQLLGDPLEGQSLIMRAAHKFSTGDQSCFTTLLETELPGEQRRGYARGPWGGGEHFDVFDDARVRVSGCKGTYGIAVVEMNPSYPEVAETPPQSDFFLLRAFFPEYGSSECAVFPSYGCSDSYYVRVREKGGRQISHDLTSSGSADAGR